MPSVHFVIQARNKQLRVFKWYPVRVKCRKETICASISLGTSSKKSIFNFSGAVEQPVCDRGPPVLPYRTVTRWWWKGTRPVASRSVGRGKEVEYSWLYRNVLKKESLTLCRQGMMHFPDNQQQSFVHFLLKPCPKVKFLVTLSCLCVTWPEHNLQLGGKSLWCVIWRYYHKHIQLFGPAVWVKPC